MSLLWSLPKFQGQWKICNLPANIFIYASKYYISMFHAICTIIKSIWFCCTLHATNFDLHCRKMLPSTLWKFPCTCNITDYIALTVIPKNMFEFFIKSNLVWPYHLGSKVDDTCINHLSWKIYRIFISRFMRIKKPDAFSLIYRKHTVQWYNGLTFKLRWNGISGNILRSLTGFFE